MIPPDPFRKTEATAKSPSARTQRSSLLSLGGELFQGLFQSVPEQLEENAGLSEEQNTELASYLQTSNPEILAKRDRVGEFLARLDSEAEAIRSEEKRLAARRAFFEKVSECLKSSIHQQMLDAGVKKIEGQLFGFSIRRNPPKVHIVDEGAIPAEFVEWTPAPNKMAIKDRLERGETVPGCELVTSTRLDIR
jgi:hypothetical protein